MKIFDTHTHINSKEFSMDIPDVLDRARAFDVTEMLVLAYDLYSSERLIYLLNNYEHIYGAMGIHPNDILKYDELEPLLISYLENNKLKALGEIGLDYHYPNFNKNKQIELFERQIDLAHKYKLPIIVHVRDAIQDVYSVIKKTDGAKYGGIIHSFDYDYKWAKKFLNLGMYISFSGIITYNNSKNVQYAATKLPIDRILVETDAPYLAPHPYRNMRNEPGMVRYTLEFLSKLRHENINILYKKIYNNAKRILNIDT